MLIVRWTKLWWPYFMLPSSQCGVCSSSLWSMWSTTFLAKYIFHMRNDKINNFPVAALVLIRTKIAPFKHLICLLHPNVNKIWSFEMLKSLDSVFISILHIVPIFEEVGLHLKKFFIYNVSAVKPKIKLISPSFSAMNIKKLTVKIFLWLDPGAVKVWWPKQTVFYILLPPHTYYFPQTLLSFCQRCKKKIPPKQTKIGIRRCWLSADRE